MVLIRLLPPALLTMVSFFSLLSGLYPFDKGISRGCEFINIYIRNGTSKLLAPFAHLQNVPHPSIIQLDQATLKPCLDKLICKGYRGAYAKVLAARLRRTFALFFLLAAVSHLMYLY